MNIRLEQIENAERWNAALYRLRSPHLLQSWEWGAFKAGYSWEPVRLLWSDRAGHPAAAAQVLFRSKGPGLTMGYCPRGPLLDWTDAVLREMVLTDLYGTARERGAFFLKLDPAIISSTAGETNGIMARQPGLREILTSMERAGYRPSDEQVQFKNTLVLDLAPDEEKLLANMKQKTRYNIRLAGRKGVSIRRGSDADLDLLYRMFAETSLRDGFVIRDPAYYQRAWGDFIQRERALPFIAEVEGEPVAAIIVFRFGEVAYYLYGMSRELHREKMPNYLLQWEAIRWAKEAGCRWYDLWGAPDELDESDPMYGVYRFKEGLGAVLVETPGAWDLPLRPARYMLYTRLMPVALSVLRFLGRRRTQQTLQE